METFADVLHNLIDHVFSGGVADKAHEIIDRASGPRSEPEPAPVADTPSPPDTPETDPAALTDTTDVPPSP